MSRVRLNNEQTKVCEWCRSEFTPYRPSQRFCPGGQCRKEYHQDEYDRQIRQQRTDTSNAAAIIGHLGGVATAKKRAEFKQAPPAGAKQPEGKRMHDEGIREVKGLIAYRDSLLRAAAQLTNDKLAERMGCGSRTIDRISAGQITESSDKNH